jgi:hypothetical protein
VTAAKSTGLEQLGIPYCAIDISRAWNDYRFHIMRRLTSHKPDDWGVNWGASSYVSWRSRQARAARLELCVRDYLNSQPDQLPADGDHILPLTLADDPERLASCEPAMSDARPLREQNARLARTGNAGNAAASDCWRPWPKSRKRVLRDYSRGQPLRSGPFPGCSLYTRD